MSGTKIGGQRAAQTNKKRHGKDFYKKIALLAQLSWVANGRKPRGFEYDREMARKWGAIGGAKSKRGGSKKKSNTSGLLKILQDKF